MLYGRPSGYVQQSRQIGLLCRVSQVDQNLCFLLFLHRSSSWWDNVFVGFSIMTLLALLAAFSDSVAQVCSEVFCPV